MRQECMRHMTMPAWPGACFIMIHSYFAFPFLQRCFNGPAQPTDADELLARTGGRCIAEVKLDLGFGFQGAPEDQPDSWAWQSISHRGGSQKGELRHQRPFATL